MGIPVSIRDIIIGANAAGGPNFNLIQDSLRFRDPSDSARQLSRTFGTPTDADVWTYSGWVKIGSTTQGTEITLLEGRDDGNNWQSRTLIFFVSDGKLRFNVITNESTTYNIESLATYRDPSAWMHVVMAYDRTAPQVQFWVNGEEIPVTGTPTTATALINRGGYGHVIGQNEFWAAAQRRHLRDHYQAEVHFIDGQYLAPTTFGEYDENGVWIPKKVSGVTYGANGFYLDFSDPTNIGADRSGNGNNWTPTGFELSNTASVDYDLMEDSPTKNFATLNSATGRWTSSTSYAKELSKANLRTYNPAQESPFVPNESTTSTQFVRPADGGVYMFESTVDHRNASVSITAYRPDENVQGTPNSALFSHFEYDCFNGNVYVSSAVTGTIVESGQGVPVNAGGVVTCVADFDNDTVSFYVDGTRYGYITNCSFADYELFGPSFSTLTKTAPYANQDVNYGQRPFRYTPVSGAKSWSTAELPAVDIKDPSEYFQTLLSNNYPVGPTPGAIGDFIPASGGYYAGTYRDSNKAYHLFLAPKTSGGLNGESPTDLQYKTSNAVDTPYSTWENGFYGGDITTLMAARSSEFPAANWMVNDATGPNAGTFDITGASNGTGINGFNDWYMPASLELQICYAAFKPGTTATHSSVNVDNAVPPILYSNISQSADPNFQTGGSEAFKAESYNAANQAGTATHADQFKCSFDNGGLNVSSGKVLLTNTRAVRREFAYDAGIIDLAQETFPNGLWWIKDRVNDNQHQLVDSVRGGNLALTSPAFGVQTAYVAPAGNSVAWCWNLVPDRSNGFDIVTWAGDNADNRRIPHSLGAIQEFQIVKCIDSPDPEFLVTYIGIPSGQTLVLNRDYAQIGGASQGVLAPPDSATTFGTITGTSGRQNINQNGLNYISYLWRSVPGYSSIGTYVGNQTDNDGPFIYTGFRPAFVLIKRIYAVGDWYVLDSERNTYNPSGIQLSPNYVTKEANYTNWGDLLSNGFKIRRADYAWNGSGSTYLYMAFAEHPFGGSNVSPSPAR